MLHTPSFSLLSQICSRTVNNAAILGDSASRKPKLIWNIAWMMKGIDVHMSQHIGKKLSALFETLTTLTEDERGAKDDEEEGEEGVFLETGALVTTTETVTVGATGAEVEQPSLEDGLQQPQTTLLRHQAREVRLLAD